jgi:hypothetical protein
MRKPWRRTDIKIFVIVAKTRKTNVPPNFPESPVFAKMIGVAIKQPSRADKFRKISLRPNPHGFFGCCMVMLFVARVMIIDHQF